MKHLSRSYEVTRHLSLLRIWLCHSECIFVINLIRVHFITDSLFPQCQHKIQSCPRFRSQPDAEIVGDMKWSYEKTLENSHERWRKTIFVELFLFWFALAAGVLIEKLSKHGNVQKRQIGGMVSSFRNKVLLHHFSSPRKPTDRMSKWRLQFDESFPR